MPRVVHIKEIKIYNRWASNTRSRINGVIVWVGTGLIGGNYDGATKVATIQYNHKRLYIYSDLGVRGSSVALQGGSDVVSLSEVEVYASTTEGWF